MDFGPLFEYTLLVALLPFILLALLVFINRKRQKKEQRNEIIARRIISGILITFLTITIVFHIITSGVAFILLLVFLKSLIG